MQDRFKFRVWKISENKMINGVTYFNPFILDETFAPEEAKNHIIMQSTGLKDKNGKLIYEGDIVRYTEVELDVENEREIAQVIWGGDDSYPAFDLKGKDFDCMNGLSYLFGDGWSVEVIGNIYETPELMEIQNG